MNTACQSDILATCPDEQCTCVTDSNAVTTDAGTRPACAAYVDCVFAQWASLLQTTDAGAVQDLQTATSTCAPSYPTASVTLGDNLVTCIVGNSTTLVACLP